MKIAMLFKSEGCEEALHTARRKGIGLFSDSDNLLRLICEKMWESIADLDFEELEAEVKKVGRRIPPNHIFRKRLLSRINQQHFTSRAKNGFQAGGGAAQEHIRRRIFHRSGSSS